MVIHLFISLFFGDVTRWKFYRCIRYDDANVYVTLSYMVNKSSFEYASA